MKSFDVGNRLIAALDVPTGDQALAMWGELAGVPAFAKLGLELFCAEGPALVRHFVAQGVRVMLDLKLHDIPATVGRATANLAGLGVALCTVHASSHAMLEQAVAAAAAPAPMGILAVTVLTSSTPDDLAASGTPCDLAQVVLARARLAHRAGCLGVVASPLEASMLRAHLPPEFLIVTPGIRPPGAELGDQKRVMTPRAARAAGADLIVVGRPLRDASSPVAVARTIVHELSMAHGETS